ncbi:MAG: LPS translocon maturation chaperone LptM [Woeseiaceae bacterium]
MKRLILAVVAIWCASLFAGCGQSGPLYLPGDPSKLETVVPAPPEDEEDEKEEDEGG